MRVITAYLAIALPLLVLDALWLGVVAKRFYRDALGILMAAPVKLVPAAIFYLGYPIGLLIFALEPSASVAGAALRGGLFGLFCYGTYDLVNHATLKGWPLRLTIVDMAWGTTISAIVTAIAFILQR